jgi:hypothetical protein
MHRARDRAYLVDIGVVRVMAEIEGVSQGLVRAGVYVEALSGGTLHQCLKVALAGQGVMPQLQHNARCLRGAWGESTI